MSTGAFDYRFVQGLVDFGRGMAGEFVGQPFEVYRVSSASNDSVLHEDNLVNEDLRAKVTHGKRSPVVENEIIHANMFEFLCSSEDLSIGDILYQKDDTYGANAHYAVASKRPLKPVTCIRTESLCTIVRAQSNKQSGYSGTTRDSDKPFVLRNGVFVLDEPGVEATVVPCGLAYIGQIKNKKPSNLPMDTLTTWWYIYVPALPGLDRIQENDVIIHQPFPDVLDGDNLDAQAPGGRYRVTGPYSSGMGTAGQFLLCERI